MRILILSGAMLAMAGCCFGGGAAPAPPINIAPGFAPQPTTGSVSPFSPGNQRIANNVFTSPPGRFLNTSIPDAGGRVIRYQLKFLF